MTAPLFTRPSSPVEARARDVSSFLKDALTGLTATPKTLPATYFYDLEGSRLFEEITRLPEYYPTRTELSILRDRALDIRALVPAGSAVIEFGAGSSEKFRNLLRTLPDVALYVPVDVSAEFLREEAAQLRADKPGLEIVPVVADFTREMRLPTELGSRPRVGFFPGSTIGNFEPSAASSLLSRFAGLLGPSALLVIGVDLVKDDVVLQAAYDDAAGVTARFNMNLLARLNRELGADFDLASFEHRALFNRALSRIEMHLVSRRAQVVLVGDVRIAFAAGETIHTENSYKYTPSAFAMLAEQSGFAVEDMFSDSERLFAVFALRVPAGLTARRPSP